MKNLLIFLLALTSASHAQKTHFFFKNAEAEALLNKPALSTGNVKQHWPTSIFKTWSFYYNHRQADTSSAIYAFASGLFYYRYETALGNITVKKEDSLLTKHKLDLKEPPINFLITLQKGINTLDPSNMTFTTSDKQELFQEVITAPIGPEKFYWNWNLLFDTSYFFYKNLQAIKTDGQILNNEIRTDKNGMVTMANINGFHYEWHFTDQSMPDVMVKIPLQGKIVVPMLDTMHADVFAEVMFFDYDIRNRVRKMLHRVQPLKNVTMSGTLNLDIITSFKLTPEKMEENAILPFFLTEVDYDAKGRVATTKSLINSQRNDEYGVYLYDKSGWSSQIKYYTSTSSLKKNRLIRIETFNYNFSQ